MTTSWGIDSATGGTCSTLVKGRGPGSELDISMSGGDCVVDFSCETRVSMVPAIHPSVISDYLVWAYTNLFVNRCLGPLMTILGWVDKNGAPWFKWLEFFSAIVVAEGLFVILGMKKLGSGVKFGLC